MKLEGMNFKRRLAITTAGLLVVAVAVFAFLQWGGGTANAPSPIVATLPTYAPNLFTGNVACGGVGWSNVRLSVSSDRAPEAYLMSTATPEAVLGGPYELTWPPGYSLALGGSGARVVGPNGTPVLPDGAIIDEMGVCPGEGKWFVWDIGPPPTP